MLGENWTLLIVRNFLTIEMNIRGQQTVLEGHQRSMGPMPASFKVIEEEGRESLVADFGERAIGRRANFFQTWSATGLIIAQQLDEDPEFRVLFDSCMYCADGD